MISLYPSHIHISFPYPYISHIYKSFIIFACCPATCFFIFHFCGVGNGGVFFLWFFGVGIVDGFRSAFRFAPRPVLPVSPFSPSFAPPFRFVCSFGCVIEAVRAAVFGAGRLACRLAWRDGGAFVVCAVFVSSFSRVVSSFLAAAVLVVAVTLFVFVPSGVSCGGVFGVGSWERGGVAVRGVAAGRRGVSWSVPLAVR